MPATRKRKASTPASKPAAHQQSIRFPANKRTPAPPTPKPTPAPTPTATPTTTKPQPPADYIQVGTHKLRVGHRLLPLTDSTDLYQCGDWHALFGRLDEDGVILVRGVIGHEAVRRARSAVLDHIRQKGALVQPSGGRTRGGADADGRALIGTTDDGKLTAGWTIDADSGGVNGDREDESATDGWRTLGTSAALTAVYNGADLKSFLHDLFSAAIQQRQHQYPLYRPTAGGQVATTFPDCTWLRIRGHKDLTIEHTDYYYFKQERSIFTDHWQPTLATPQPPTQPPPPTCTLCSNPTTPTFPTLQCALCLHTFHRSCLAPAPPSQPRGAYYCPACANLPFPFYTCWIALGSVHRRHGRLALVPGSQRLAGYEERRGGGDGKLPRQWRGDVAGGAVWRSSDMEAGDVLLFNVKTVHGASVNVSDEFRISMDTRVTFAARRSQPLPSPADDAAQPQPAGSKQVSSETVPASGAADGVSERASGGVASGRAEHWSSLTASDADAERARRAERQREERSLRRQTRTRRIYY